jgi:triosephosphate isomerase
MTQNKPLYFVANWKSNKTWGEAVEYMHDFSMPEIPSIHQVILCPPFPYVAGLKAAVSNSPIVWGVQDLSPFPYGAYTGAVTGGMLKGMATHAIVGHSERRNYFHESNQDVANKVRTALENDVTPIVCVDEPYLETQLAYFTDDQFKKMIIAYEPLAAIGSGTPDTSEHADQIGERIWHLSQTDVPVLYGGSVKPETVAAFVSMPHIAGVLVGGASLDPRSWRDLVDRGSRGLN